MAHAVVGTAQVRLNNWVTEADATIQVYLYKRVMASYQASTTS